MRSDVLIFIQWGLFVILKYCPISGLTGQARFKLNNLSFLTVNEEGKRVNQNNNEVAEVTESDLEGIDI